MRALRALGAIIPPKRLTRPPPSGPSCSRWLSCSCCRRERERPPYFNRNTVTVTIEPEAPIQYHRPTIHPAQSSSTPHLPLPPRLPYSPDSVPFKRHLQILSLSLLCERNDESWSTYEALHPSLRRYIPDDTFRSLLAHQLRDTRPIQQWQRTVELINFAKQCGMEGKGLGVENLRNAIRSGLRYVLRTKRDETEKYRWQIGELWKHSMEADMGNVALDLRKSWIRLHLRRPGDRNPLIIAARVMKELVDRGGGKGLEEEAEEIVAIRQRTEAGRVEVMELAEYYMYNGITISTKVLSTRLENLNRLWNDNERVQELVSRLATPKTRDHWAAAVDQFLLGTKTRGQRAEDIIASGGLEELFQVANDRASDPQTVMRAVERLLQIGPTAEHFTHQMTAKMPAPLFVQFVNLLIRHDVLPQYLLIRFFQRMISAIPSTDAYLLARKMYPAARAAGHKWTLRNAALWKRFFHHAIDRRRRHLHFASRLYADFQADGMSVEKRDALMMIRSIGMSQSASRMILLERHIKDYLWEEDRADRSLVMSLVDGLTSGRSADDAVLALDLSRRLWQDQPLPPQAASAMISKLTLSPLRSHFRIALELLPIANSAESFNQVLYSVVAHSRLNPKPGEMSRQDALAHAIAIYKEMVARDLAVTSRTVSLLLRALIDAGYTASALAVFRASLAEGIIVKSNAVGRLMVRLALEEKYDEADQVERDWRGATLPDSSMRYDRGVVGARVLLDVKRGIKVDLEKVAKETGWLGTAPFLRFLKTVAPEEATAPGQELGPAGQIWDVLGEQNEVGDQQEAVDSPLPLGSAGESETVSDERQDEQSELVEQHVRSGSA